MKVVSYQVMTAVVTKVYHGVTSAGKMMQGQNIASTT